MFVLFDIGGTKTRLVLSRDGETFTADPEVFATPANYNDGLEEFSQRVLRLSGGEKIAMLAGGLPGPFDTRQGVLVAAPNLAGWVGKPWREDLKQKLQAPVLVENDAALVGLGEAVFGAGRGERLVAYLTVSTGVGGARIIDGRIDERGLSFEPGHQIIDPTRTLCPKAKGPYLEDLISGTAVTQLMGRPPREVVDPEFWEQLAYWLALGLNNVIVHWSPQVVVLGGSMFREPGIKIEAVERHLAKILRIFGTPPALRSAALGDFGGLYGAMALLRATAPSDVLRR